MAHRRPAAPSGHMLRQNPPPPSNLGPPQRPSRSGPARNCLPTASPTASNRFCKLPCNLHLCVCLLASGQVPAEGSPPSLRVSALRPPPSLPPSPPQFRHAPKPPRPERGPPRPRRGGGGAGQRVVPLRDRDRLPAHGGPHGPVRQHPGPGLLRAQVRAGGRHPALLPRAAAQRRRAEVRGGVHPRDVRRGGPEVAGAAAAEVRPQPAARGGAVRVHVRAAVRPGVCRGGRLRTGAMGAGACTPPAVTHPKMRVRMRAVLAPWEALPCGAPLEEVRPTDWRCHALDTEPRLQCLLSGRERWCQQINVDPPPPPSVAWARVLLTLSRRGRSGCGGWGVV